MSTAAFLAVSPEAYRGVLQTLVWKLGSEGSGKSLFRSKSVWDPLSYYLLEVQLRGMRYSWYFTLCLCLLEVWPYCSLGREVIGSLSSSSRGSMRVYLSKGRRRRTAGPQAVLQETPGWVMKAGRLSLRPQVALVRKAATIPCAHYAFAGEA